MNTATAASPHTPDDLLALPDGGKGYELVDGHLVEKPMSEESNCLGGWIAHLINSYAAPRRLGLVVPEQTYRCFPNKPGQIRRPDVSFIRRERRPRGPERGGHTLEPPDLIVEVLSPGDEVISLQEKLDDYFSAAVPIVWIVNPVRRSVEVYTAGDPVPQILRGDAILTGGAVLPEFTVRIEDIFTLFDPME